MFIDMYSSFVPFKDKIVSNSVKLVFISDFWTKLYLLYLN
jgi:hypothetical protein